MTTTTTSTDAARITDHVAAALGWTHYETTGDLEPVEHEGRWYLAIRDGIYSYFVDLAAAGEWADGYERDERDGSEEPYTEFCQDVDVIDPRRIASMFANIEDFSGVGGIDGDATMSADQWLRSIADEDAEEPAWRCVSDRYDADPSTRYHDEADFQRMCHAVFGEFAILHLDGEVYRDETGAVVLEQVA